VKLNKLSSSRQVIDGSKGAVITLLSEKAYMKICAKLQGMTNKMRSNLLSVVSCLLMSVASLFAYANSPTLSEIPIETEFGITLGSELPPNLMVEELKKKPWKTNSTYRLNPVSTESLDIRVSVTSENKVYSILAFKELKGCETEFQVLRESFESKYQITQPQRDFKITNTPTEHSHRKISGYCDGRSIKISIKDVAVSIKVNNENSLSHESFKQGLPECTAQYLRPISWGWMSSAYGERTDPFSGKRAWHDEIDFAGKLDQLVYASDRGVIFSTSFDKGYGNRVEIEHSNGDITTYSQLNSFLVHTGELVGKGQPIGKLGSTGRSTGPHVGFGIKRAGKFIDPKPHMVKLKSDTCRSVYQELK